MSVSGTRETVLAVATAILWGTTTVLGMLGLGYEAMFPALALLCIYAVQGAARQGRVSGRFLVYPILTWVACWAASFWLARHYADVFSGRAPDFTILGFHPSFAWTVLGYWVGGVATLSIGFVLLRDEWLGADEWAEFKRRVAVPEQDRGGER